MRSYSPGDTSDIGRAAFKPVALGSLFGNFLRRAQIRNSIECYCESPIEADLATFLIERFHKFPNVNFVFCRQEDERHFGDCNVILMPQFKWKRFRMDFAFRYGAQRLLMFIECDGKEFHSTPAQIANDRAKDAEAAADGIVLLRFSGAELYRWDEATFGLILNAQRQQLRSAS